MDNIRIQMIICFIALEFKTHKYEQQQKLHRNISYFLMDQNECGDMMCDDG